MPLSSVVVPNMDGFSSVDENDEGPLQLYTAPGVGVKEVSNNVPPEHTGLLLDATGTCGVESTIALTVYVLLHPRSVSVTVYTPASDVLMPAITGF